MQVILGSGGAIGRPLAAALSDYTDHVRCCSRSVHALPERYGTEYEHIVTDLLDAAAVHRAVAGAEVVYLTAGLPYRKKVWRRDWPILINNVIAACAAAGAKLAFFDNVYALSPEEYDNMTEETPLAPQSIKGRIRKQVLDRIWSAHRSGEIVATVARAADFYGPGVTTSLFNAMIIDKLQGQSTPMWIGDPDLPHSFTYTPDAGRHFALLGNRPEAWGETWHLPTDGRAWTVREMMVLAAELMGKPAKIQTLPKPFFWALGLFNSDLRELWDVREQFLRPYRLNSGKFARTFGVRATPYEEGLRGMIDAAETG